MLATTNLNGIKFISSKFFSISKNEITYGGYIPALVGPALVITTAVLTNTSITIPLLIVSYLIPLMVYSYDYYRDMDKDKDTNQERAASFNRKKQIYPFIMVGYLSLLFVLLLVFSNLMMILFILSLIMVGVLYPLGLKNITQKIPAFKNMFTILIWAAAGTFSLAFFNSYAITLTYFLIFLFFFIKMLPNTIFFDLKDETSDRKEGLKTIPVLLGKQRTLRFLSILNILAFIPLSVGIYLHLIPLYASVMSVFLIYSLYYLNKTKTSDAEKKMNYYLLADTEFIIWPFVLVLGKFFVFGAI